MITIPVAAAVKFFKWQISLFQFAQIRSYGDIDVFNKSLILIADRNDHKFIIKDVDWNIRLPYKVVPGIHSILPESDNHPHFAAGNLFFALKPIINSFDDNEIICLVDADVVPLKQYNGPVPSDKFVITCNYYEDWHMKCSRPEKENYHVIKPHLKHENPGYMDGGFVPIIIKAKTLKLIIDEVIDVSLKIVREHVDTPFGWWMQMWAFQVACHNNKIQCISQDNTYFPNVNELDINKHFFAHYSCDIRFKKSSFPNHNVEQFPNNVFYNIIREWYFR